MGAAVKWGSVEARNASGTSTAGGRNVPHPACCTRAEPAANPSASFGVQVLSFFIHWRQRIDLFIGWQVSSVGERWAAVHGHLALPSGSLASPLAGHRTELALGSAPI